MNPSLTVTKKKKMAIFLFGQKMSEYTFVKIIICNYLNALIFRGEVPSRDGTGCHRIASRQWTKSCRIDVLSMFHVCSKVI